MVNMDIPEVSSFAPALSGASVFVQQNPSTSAQQFSHHQFIFHEVSHKESGTREMTKQQWRLLKPLIQQVYIEENKPFPYLANILRDEYGFEPTYKSQSAMYFAERRQC